MGNKIYKVILALGFLFIIASFIYFLFFAQEQRTRGICKCVVLLITYVYAIVKNRKKSIPLVGAAIYEKKYKDIVEGTFEGDKSSYKKLLKVAVAYNADEFGKAHRILDSLLNKCSSTKDFVAVYMFRGFCYSDEERNEDAVEAYQKVLQYDMANSSAWSNIGLHYMELGKMKAAEDAYKKAILYEPANAYAYTNIAVMYIRLGDVKMALSNGLKALELDSRIHQAMEVVSIAYKILGDNTNAEKYCQMYGMNGGKKSDLQKLLNTIA